MNSNKLLDKLRLYCVLHNISPNNLAKYSLTCRKCSRPCQSKTLNLLMAEIDTNTNKIIQVANGKFNRTTLGTCRTCVEFINSPKK
jgi:hypothetical protein